VIPNRRAAELPPSWKAQPFGEPRPPVWWRTFLDNHAKQLVSIDFFTCPVHQNHQ